VDLIEIADSISDRLCTGSDQDDLTVAWSGWHHLDFGRAAQKPDTTETTPVGKCGWPARGPVATPRSLP
jgi:hypothetical protein